MIKKLSKMSDFKIISISLSAILIFFTITFFRYLPLNIFGINEKTLSNGVATFYFILTELIALITTIIFILTFYKKNDKELKIRLKSIGVGVGALAIYFLLPYFQSIPFVMFGIDTENLPMVLKIIYLIFFYILMMAIILLIYNKKITKDYKDMKKNNIKYFSKYIKYWFICLFIMMASNLIINFFITNSLPNNEEAIRDTFNISPIYVFFSAVIYAPIVEELIFRLSIKKIFNSKWLFIIISGLFFGGMHVFNDFNSLADLLYIIPYSAPGIVFALMLEDSDNILVPISFHLLHNGILISLQFLMMFLG